MATTAFHYVQNGTASDASDINQFVDVLTGVANAPGITVNSLTVQSGGLNLLQSSFTATGAADNITMSGGASGSNAVTISALGTDTNVSINMIPQAAGAVQILGATNYLALQGSATSVNVAVGASTLSGDTNVGLSLLCKASSTIVLGSTSLANYVLVTPAATLNAPAVSAGGSDTNITLQLVPKGTGSIALTNSLGNFVLQTNGTTATQANFVLVSSATTGNAPSVGATGSDSAVDLTLNTKSTGLVNIGYATNASTGGSSTATLSTTGVGAANQPGTPAQNSWLKVKVNGTLSYVPLWR